MKTLRELNAFFVQFKRDAVDPTQWIDGVLHTDGFRTLYTPVASLAEAHGIWFDCPLCANNQKAHGVCVWFVGSPVPSDVGCNSANVAVRWQAARTSTSLDDLVLTPSILLQGGCNWHGWVGSAGVPPGHAG